MASEIRVLEVVKAGDVLAVENLLDTNPTLVNSHDDMGNSALLLALYYGHKEVAQVLIARGAELNIFESAAAGVSEHAKALLTADPSLIRAYSHDGFTALHLAAFFGHVDLVEFLLAQGAEVDAVAHNPMSVTPLHSAVAHHQKNIALAVSKALVNAGASVNARQTQGFTPLQGAAQNGNLELIKFLIASGADIAARSDDGKTAYDIALESEQPEAAALVKP